MTLRELVILLRSVSPHLRSPGNVKFSVQHVYLASSSDPFSWEHKDLGIVFGRDLSGKTALLDGSNGGRGGRNDPSLKTLEQHKFIPGDYLDIAYITLSGTGGAHGQGSAGPGGPSIPSLQPRVGGPPSGQLPGGSGGRFGLSEADQAWGIAGEPRRRPFPNSSRGVVAGGLSGGNRFNPLTSGRGGINIAGSASRRLIGDIAPTNGNDRFRRDRDGEQRLAEKDGDRQMD